MPSAQTMGDLAPSKQSWGRHPAPSGPPPPAPYRLRGFLPAPELRGGGGDRTPPVSQPPGPCTGVTQQVCALSWGRSSATPDCKVTASGGGLHWAQRALSTRVTRAFPPRWPPGPSQTPEPRSARSAAAGTLSPGTPVTSSPPPTAPRSTAPWCPCCLLLGNAVGKPRGRQSGHPLPPHQPLLGTPPTPGDASGTFPQPPGSVHRPVCPGGCSLSCATRAPDSEDTHSLPESGLTARPAGGERGRFPGPSGPASRDLPSAVTTDPGASRSTPS